MTVRRVILPIPPNPKDRKYVDDNTSLLVDMCSWMTQAKSLIENYARLQSAPAGQQLIATNFTTNTVITGTSTLPDVANFLASFVMTLQNKGIVSPTVTRQDNQ